ncbi:MAG: aminopeptidase P N-terminal domain-containing protein [Bacteroidetes bacterium]|nr:aminopeptidase P N-terminal domain-containing protein [Bacteroidota bacterium]
MKYTQLDSSIFVENRKRFTEKLKPGSIAIITSNYEYSWNGDSTHKFKQNSDLFWLTGIDQEDSFLVLFPDCPINEYKEALFLVETNESIATWNGHKYTQQEAFETSGIKNVFWNDNFPEKLRAVINMAEYIYLSLNENDRYTYNSPYKALDFAYSLKKIFPLHKYERAAPILQRLRSIKSEKELAIMRHAVAIHKKALLRVLKFVKPGVGEWEIEAELIHEFIRNRGNGHSFAPIVASGPSACVLHYIENNKVCQDGHLLLLDTGCDYANYASDMTRCMPVNGRFSPRQKQVYNAVLTVMRQARELLKPGTFLMEYHKEVGHLMEKQLVDLGLLTMNDIYKQDPNNPAYKKYFMHGTSHFLGIDVHDVGMRYEPMQAGMTFSCEPGIYIKEEGIGVRIENEILIGKEHFTDLMDEVQMPIEAEEIEALMN